MIYEIYIDSLFLINFVMNLIVLVLVNHCFSYGAGRLGMVLGAAFGAFVYCLLFFLPGDFAWKMGAGSIVGSLGMTGIVFPVRGRMAFFRAIKRLLLFSLMMGGGLLSLFRLFPALRGGLTGGAGLLGTALLLGLFLGVPGKRREKGEEICRAILYGKGKKIMVKALWDTGNSLVEPLSHKPVCILERECFEQLFEESQPEGFRAIPYHSIGRERGLLPGYLVPRLQVETEGVIRSVNNVYVGVLDGQVSAERQYEMIINPRVLSKQ